MRPETGPMKFGNDWRGVFVRGDDAFMYATHLRQALESNAGISRAVMAGLLALLEASNEQRPDETTQLMRHFEEAVADHDVLRQRDHEQSPDRGEGPE